MLLEEQGHRQLMKWPSSLIGLGLGVPVALAARHAARSLLSGMSPNAMTLLALTGAAVAAVAGLASAWPAQRASRTQVATALRAE